MAIIEGWCPPTKENWEIVMMVWRFFPVFTGLQWLTDWYGMGKTSTDSKFNIPGKIGWATMEAPGFLTLLYIMFNLPEQVGLDYKKLPLGNWVMCGLFVIHYLYRAILYPLVLQPSMSPIHPLVWLFAFIFQITNATSIGGYLAGHGPTTPNDWAGSQYRMELGLVIFFFGLMGNIFHDDDLREIRRTALRRQRAEAEKRSKETGEPIDKAMVSVDKVYMLPKNGLFHYVLFPHYLCEWIEWGGFWMVGGWNCVPAQCFLINEIFSMLPRALQGWHWYVQKFGRDKVGNRKAIIPGIL